MLLGVDIVLEFDVLFVIDDVDQLASCSVGVFDLLDFVVGFGLRQVVR